MKSAVAAVFPTFTAHFEGRCTWMYQDVLGLVTTACGNLVDPQQYAISLPWKKPYGTRASIDEIKDGWQAVKNASHKMLAEAYKTDCDLRLDEADVDALVLTKMRSNELALKGRFAGWEDLPASAQLATHSLAWACGPYFGFVKFSAALNARQWDVCAEECQMSAAGNPGLVPRNAANRALFLACATTDPETVAWP